MPKASTQNPDKLTKAAIQRELKKNGIKFDGSLLKVDLVDLYRTKLLERPSSSDDEPPIARITRSAKKSQQKRVQVSLERIHLERMTQFEELSNEELEEKLREHGISFGPIVSTTRKIYERKLERALEGSGVGDAKLSSRDDDYSDRDSAEEEEQVEVVETPAPIETRARRRAAGEGIASATRRRPLHAARESPRPVTAPKELFEPIPLADDNVAAKPQRRWLPFWATLLMVAAIVIFFYFVFISMEANPAKLIPKTR